MAAKPDKMPWEIEPFEDRKAATAKAKQAAQWLAPSSTTAAQKRYAEAAFTSEITKLENAPEGERNKQLNISALCLAELVAAGTLDESTVRRALYDACQVNGHLPDDGERMVLGTIESGFEKGLRQPRDLSGITGSTTYHYDDERPVVQRPKLVDIEAGFWTKRESLQQIYLGALSHMCSPWAVLAHCAARALATVPPSQQLPSIIGGPGSLNWFAAVVGASSGGKSSAGKPALKLVRQHVPQRNLGSGEGFVDAYVKPADKETGEPQGLHEAIMFVVDEGEALNALTNRSGATLSAIVRSAFGGETIGFSYRGASSRHLESHTYRLTLMVNLQPAKAGVLLDDRYGGTLQRFMWFPASDERIELESPPEQAPLRIPGAKEWQYPRELKVPYVAKHLIKQERVKAMRGEGDEDGINGHSLYIREKFAFALAVLDGRTDMNEDDWRLAGTASRVSEHTRAWVSAELETAARKDAEHRGTLQGISSAAADEERRRVGDERVKGVARSLLDKLTKAGLDGITKRNLAKTLNSRDRHHFEPAMQRIEAMGHASFDEGTKTWTVTATP